MTPPLNGGSSSRLNGTTVTTPTGIAVIGCGHWGVNHVRVFDNLPDARVLTVCDRRMDELAKLARAFPQVSVTTDLETALSTPGV